jgi:hypothetical protein
MGEAAMFGLAADSLKPNKLKMHLETVHAKCVGKKIRMFPQKIY